MPTPSRIVYYRRPKRRKPFPRARLYLFLGLILVVVLSWGLRYLANLPYLRIQRISVSGTKTIAPADVEATAKRAIAGTRWWVIPRDHLFLISSRELAATLERAFPSAEKIVVRKKIPPALAIIVTERTLWGIYCQKLEAIGPCFYIDRAGIAYGELTSSEGSLIRTIYAPWPVSPGGQALKTSLIDFYGRAAVALERLPAKLIGLELAPSTPRDARLLLDEGWYLIVPVERDPGEWTGILRTVLDREIGPRRPSLEYVDLRFGSKVFYKFK